MSYLYGGEDSSIAGEAKAARSTHVMFRHVITGAKRLRLLQIGIIFSLVNFIFLTWLINPHHIAKHSPLLVVIITIMCFFLFVFLELVRLVTSLALWFFAYNAVDPVPQVAPPGGRIALLTTLADKEQIKRAAQTLKAMKQVAYQGSVDSWILDETNNPELQQIAASLGAKYFSRKGIKTLNTPSGALREGTKFGNLNAWRHMHEQAYDIVAQINPGSLPQTNFLERTLGYFLDPDIAFVTTPRVNGIQGSGSSWLSRAAGAQRYIFQGILQRGGNKFGSPVLTDSNHLYRVVAWQQIGGFQDSIHDDHLTSMTIHGSKNPFTGKAWQSIYTPDAVVLDQGPSSWNEYFEQQHVSVYVIWEMILYHDLRLDKRLKPGQSIYYASLLYFFPSLVVAWMIGNLISVLYFIFGIVVMNVPDIVWVFYWCFSVGSQLYLFLWLNSFNLNDYERERGGLDAIAITLATIPVYVHASIQAILGRPYVKLTGSGEKQKIDEPLSAFKYHLQWGLILSGILLFGLINTGSINGQFIWLLLALCITLGPFAMAYYGKRRQHLHKVQKLRTSQL